MSDAEQLDADKALVTRALSQLAEHFDSVQIFCTRHNPEDKNVTTTNCVMGRGNWFMRYGQLREWLIAEDEKIRIATRTEDETQK